MGFGDLTVSHGLMGERQEVALVRIGGEVDVYTFPTVREYLKTELLEVDEPPAHVGLELSGVTWFDSCALGMVVGFIKAFRVLRPSGAVVVVAPAEKERRLWEVTGLVNVVPMVLDVDRLLPFLEGWNRPASAEDGNAEDLCA